MALLDVASATKYGLSTVWADKLFNSQIPMGKGQVYYSDSCSFKNTWGVCQSRPAIRDKDVYLTGDSILHGSNLEVSGGSWFANSPDTGRKYWDIVRNSSPSNQMWVSGPLIKEAGEWDGPSSWSFKGVNTYLDYGNFTPGNITFRDSGTSYITTGEIITNASQMAAGPNAQLTFDFLPGGMPKFELSYSTANKVSITTTNGTRNSDSTTNTATVGISNALKVSASAGIKDVAQVSAENTLTISAGWTGAWNNINEVNFSKASTTEQVDTTTVKVNIDLNGLKAKPDGTYSYSTQAPTVNGVSSNVPLSTVNFVPGKKYRAVITFNQANVQNIINGSYEIGGNIGSIKDSFGNSVSMTAAQALDIANKRQGPDILYYSSGSLGSLNDSKTAISYNGQALASTSLSYNFDVSYFEVVTPPGTSTGGYTKNSLFKSKFNLASLDSHKSHDHSSHNALGSYLALETKKGELSLVIGSGHESIIEASPDGQHQFVNHAYSFLTGNDNDDSFTFDRVSEGNTIVSEAGDDMVKASSSQNADLGDGNDTYIIKGGYNHKITTGAGKDTIVVENRKSSFHISDFDFMSDRVIAGGKLKNAEIRYELDWPDQSAATINSIGLAALSFYWFDHQVGTASIDQDAASFAGLNSPETFLEIVGKLL